MMIVLNSYEIIKKASTYAWINRINVVFSFQLTNRTSMVVISRYLFMYVILLVFSESSILFLVTGYEWVCVCVLANMSPWSLALWECEVKLSRMSQLSRILQPLVLKRYPRARLVETLLCNIHNTTTTFTTQPPQWQQALSANHVPGISHHQYRSSVPESWCCCDHWEDEETAAWRLSVLCLGPHGWKRAESGIGLLFTILMAAWRAGSLGLP